MDAGFSTPGIRVVPVFCRYFIGAGVILVTIRAADGGSRRR
jgi:hypothetical protein